MAALGLKRTAALIAELGDLKRLRDPSHPDSLAVSLFSRAWSALFAGAPITLVTDVITSDALAAARLGGIDRDMLGRVGLTRAEARDVLIRSVKDVLGAVSDWCDPGAELPWSNPPAFVDALARQPRAGATCPGKPRIVLEPAESHADHCLLVAVGGALLAEFYGSDRATPFLAGLVHHAHNAVLPDSGFAGEMLLGTHLAPIMLRLFDEAYSVMPLALADAFHRAMDHAASADSPAGRAFHAADVLDRVLQMRHYETVAGFTLGQALDDLRLVHEGPVQAFHHHVLSQAGLRE